MYMKRLERTLTCLGRLHQAYRDAGVLETLASRCRVISPHDAREPLLVVPAESQALVMTSPPYFNAVDYPRAHRMSLCWMNGYAPTALASRRYYMGLRHAGEFALDAWLLAHPWARHLLSRSIFDHGALARRLCTFFPDLEEVLIQISHVLRSGGHAVFVIANNSIKGERIASHSVLVELATNLGFMAVETTPRPIAGLHRRFPVGPFGFAGPMTHEFLVVLRKP
jgi:hypothetical protein